MKRIEDIYKVGETVSWNCVNGETEGVIVKIIDDSYILVKTDTGYLPINFTSINVL